MINLGGEFKKEAEAIQAIFDALYCGTKDFTNEVRLDIMARLARIRSLAKKVENAQS